MKGVPYSLILLKGVPYSLIQRNTVAHTSSVFSMAEKNQQCKFTKRQKSLFRIAFFQAWRWMKAMVRMLFYYSCFISLFAFLTVCHRTKLLYDIVRFRICLTSLLSSSSGYRTAVFSVAIQLIISFAFVDLRGLRFPFVLIIRNGMRMWLDLIFALHWTLTGLYSSGEFGTQFHIQVKNN